MASFVASSGGGGGGTNEAMGGPALYSVTLSVRPSDVSSFFILHKVWTWYFQDRVSRVLFPSTFILLNIIYWLVFSDILDSLHSSSDLSSYPSQWIL